MTLLKAHQWTNHGSWLSLPHHSYVSCIDKLHGHLPVYPLEVMHGTVSGSQFSTKIADPTRRAAQSTESSMRSIFGLEISTYHDKDLVFKMNFLFR